jgi:hypothetical protein
VLPNGLKIGAITLGYGASDFLKFHEIVNRFVFLEFTSLFLFAFFNYTS